MEKVGRVRGCMLATDPSRASAHGCSRRLDRYAQVVERTKGDR